jgi:hypothetical protein
MAKSLHLPGIAEHVEQKISVKVWEWNRDRLNDGLIRDFSKTRGNTRQEIYEGRSESNASYLFPWKLQEIQDAE